MNFFQHGLGLFLRGSHGEHSSDRAHHLHHASLGRLPISLRQVIGNCLYLFSFHPWWIFKTSMQAAARNTKNSSKRLVDKSTGSPLQDQLVHISASEKGKNRQLESQRYSASEEGRGCWGSEPERWRCEETSTASASASSSEANTPKLYKDPTFLPTPIFPQWGITIFISTTILLSPILIASSQVCKKPLPTSSPLPHRRLQSLTTLGRWTLWQTSRASLIVRILRYKIEKGLRAVL